MALNYSALFNGNSKITGLKNYFKSRRRSVCIVFGRDKYPGGPGGGNRFKITLQRFRKYAGRCIYLTNIDDLPLVRDKPNHIKAFGMLEPIGLCQIGQSNFYKIVVVVILIDANRAPGSWY